MPKTASKQSELSAQQSVNRDPKQVAALINEYMLHWDENTSTEIKHLLTFPTPHQGARVDSLHQIQATPEWNPEDVLWLANLAPRPGQPYIGYRLFQVTPDGRLHVPTETTYLKKDLYDQEAEV